MSSDNQITLSFDDDKAEVKVEPFQFSTRTKGALTFLNQSEKVLTVDFRPCHPLAVTENELSLFPNDTLTLRVSKELHFSFQVQQGGTGPQPQPRPRVAIITILQPVSVSGSPSYDLNPPESGARPTTITFFQDGPNLNIDPAILAINPNQELIFQNKSERLLNLTFVASSPFIESDQAVQFELAGKGEAKKQLDIIPAYHYRVETIDNQGPSLEARGQLRAALG